MSKDTSAIKEYLYPIVEMKMKSNEKSLIKQFEQFMRDRTDALFSPAPYTRIAFGEKDSTDLFESIGISKSQVTEAISHTYYYPMASFNPRYAKDEITILLTTIARYYIIKKDIQNANKMMLYLSFTGKMYPSIHYLFFKIEPVNNKPVMEYVINNLSGSFLLRKSGNIIKSVSSISTIVLDTYTDYMKEFTDEQICYIVQQLHNRIKGFMKNIAQEFYKAYENKEYIMYQSDSSNDENFKVSETNSTRAERAIESAMNRLSVMKVDYKYCKMASNSLVHVDELLSIIESIFVNKDNINTIRELVTCIVYSFVQRFPELEISDIKFISYTITPKSNSTDKLIVKIKDIVYGFLSTSERYNRRKGRLATKNAYYNAVLLYFTLMIHISNK